MRQHGLVPLPSDPDPLDAGPLDAGPLDAGPFGPWLDRMVESLAGRADTDVPCGSCVGCCSSRQFVHVEPDEHDALAHIPPELRFPAPGLPPGFVVLPYDEQGRCPMLGADGCTIYEHRPRTCRVYDCRVLTAAAVEPDADQPLIAERVRRWRFQVADTDRERFEAVRATARVLREPLAHPDGRVPTRASQLAAMAVGLHRLAMHDGHAVAPTTVAVRVELSRRRG